MWLNVWSTYVLPTFLNKSILWSIRTCTSHITQVHQYPTRIFSGIQPTGTMHIGNYLGAIRNWVSLQQDSKATVFYSVVDLHSITLPQDPAILQLSVRNMAIYLLACGVDPTRSIIFQQSKVSQHAELAWILGCLAPIGFLNRMHQWKSKRSENKDKTCLGLYSYPVLMAADILLYKATHVPIGDDQVQHLELAREVCRLFNNTYGDFFPSPQPILGKFTRVMSLRDATIKMSKSDPLQMSRIKLSDPPTVIKNKIQKAVTDSESHIGYDPENRPAMANLINIYSAFSGLSPEDICSKYHNVERFKALFKADLTELIVSELSSIQDSIVRLQRDIGYVENVLEGGAGKARDVADLNLQEVKRLVGLK